MSIIPPQYRLLAGIVALAIALIAAAGAGAVVNGWRLDGEHQRAMTAEKDRYEELAEKVREQNRGVEALASATKSADERRQVAETYAAAVIKRIGTRADAVANSTATNCNGVLQEAWEAWK